MIIEINSGYHVIGIYIKNHNGLTPGLIDEISYAFDLNYFLRAHKYTCFVRTFLFGSNNQTFITQMLN